MIVIERNGRTTVITGWRAWLVGIVALAAVWLVLALLAFLWIGAAITIGIAFLLIVPALVLVAVARGMFFGMRS